MDHSVKSYLERQSTEQLQAFLFYCLDDSRFRKYEDSIKIAWKILQERDMHESHEIPERLYEMWDRIVEGKTDQEEKS